MTINNINFRLLLNFHRKLKQNWKRKERIMKLIKVKIEKKKIIEKLNNILNNIINEYKKIVFEFVFKNLYIIYSFNISYIQ